MAKKNITIFEIFLQSLGLYFSNIDRFMLYMAFPVFGQLLGMIITVSLIYFFANYNTVFLASMPMLQNQMYANIVIALILIPSIALLIKAFCDYMVAYSAVNSMTDNMLKSERVYDFPAHTLMVTRR